MPPQPMPATESTVQGSITDLLLADSALFALVPASSIYAGEAVPEAQLPFIVVHGADVSRRWVTTTNRLETTQLRIEVYAKAGVTAAGQPNPAEAIAANIERIINWQDLPIPGTVPIRIEQKSHTLTEEQKRAGDKSRVWKVILTWEVELYVRG